MRPFSAPEHSLSYELHQQCILYIRFSLFEAHRYHIVQSLCFSQIHSLLLLRLKLLQIRSSKHAPALHRAILVLRPQVASLGVDERVPLRQERYGYAGSQYCSVMLVLVGITYPT